MKRQLAVGTLAAAFVLAGCPDSSSSAASKQRAELRALNGSTLEVHPAEGQLPYCLLFSITQAGTPPTIRQLTMTHENKSVPCEANRAIGGISYRIPIEEGKIRILVFFSNAKLSAGSVAQQIYELSKENPNWNTLDLRLPGQVFIQTLEFDPRPDSPVQAGGLVGSTGDIQGAAAGSADAGSAPAPDAGKP